MLGAGRGVGDDREGLAGDGVERGVQLFADAGGFLGEAFAEEGLAAALAVEMIGHDGVEAGALEQRDHRVGRVEQIVLGLRRTEHAGGAGGEIDDARIGHQRGRHRETGDLRVLPRLGRVACLRCAGAGPERARDAGHAGDLAHRAGDRVGRAVADDGARHGVEADAGAHQGFDAAGVAGDEVRRLPLAIGAAAGALAEHHRAGLDAHRAALGADVAGGAGVEAGVLEVVVQRGKALRALAGLAQAGAFAGDRDALARTEGQMRRGTGRLAEPALDAEVDDGVGQRHQLQALDVKVGVRIEQDAGVEQALGIEDLLDPVHQHIGLGAPLALDEGGDGAAGAVLGLEAAAVADRDQLGEIAVEDVEPGDLAPGHRNRRP